MSTYWNTGVLYNDGMTEKDYILGILNLMRSPSQKLRELVRIFNSGTPTYKSIFEHPDFRKNYTTWVNNGKRNATIALEKGAHGYYSLVARILGLKEFSVYWFNRAKDHYKNKDLNGLIEDAQATKKLKDLIKKLQSEARKNMRPDDDYYYNDSGDAFYDPEFKRRVNNKPRSTTLKPTLQKTAPSTPGDVVVTKQNNEIVITPASKPKQTTSNAVVVPASNAVVVPATPEQVVVVLNDLPRNLKAKELVQAVKASTTKTPSKVNPQVVQFLRFVQDYNRFAKRNGFKTYSLGRFGADGIEGRYTRRARQALGGLYNEYLKWSKNNRGGYQAFVNSKKPIDMPNIDYNIGYTSNIVLPEQVVDDVVGPSNKDARMDSEILQEQQAYIPVSKRGGKVIMAKQGLSDDAFWDWGNVANALWGYGLKPVVNHAGDLLSGQTFGALARLIQHPSLRSLYNMGRYFPILGAGIRMGELFNPELRDYADHYYALIDDDAGLVGIRTAKGKYGEYAKDLQELEERNNSKEGLKKESSDKDSKKESSKKSEKSEKKSKQSLPKSTAKIVGWTKDGLPILAKSGTKLIVKALKGIYLDNKLFRSFITGQGGNADDFYSKLQAKDPLTLNLYNTYLDNFKKEYTDIGNGFYVNNGNLFGKSGKNYTETGGIKWDGKLFLNKRGSTVRWDGRKGTFLINPADSNYRDIQGYLNTNGKNYRYLGFTKDKGLFWISLDGKLWNRTTDHEAFNLKPTVLTTYDISQLNKYSKGWAQRAGEDFLRNNRVIGSQTSNAVNLLDYLGTPQTTLGGNNQLDGVTVTASRPNYGQLANNNGLFTGNDVGLFQEYANGAGLLGKDRRALQVDKKYGVNTHYAFSNMTDDLKKKYEEYKTWKTNNPGKTYSDFTAQPAVSTTTTTSTVTPAALDNLVKPDFTLSVSLVDSRYGDNRINTDFTWGDTAYLGALNAALRKAARAEGRTYNVYDIKTGAILNTSGMSRSQMRDLNKSNKREIRRLKLLGNLGSVTPSVYNSKTAMDMAIAQGGLRGTNVMIDYTGPKVARPVTLPATSNSNLFDSKKADALIRNSANLQYDANKTNDLINSRLGKSNLIDSEEVDNQIQNSNKLQYDPNETDKLLKNSWSTTARKTLK